MTDVAEKLFEFLDNHPCRTMEGIAAGSGRDYVYEIPESDVTEFERLYLMAARGSVDDLEDDPLPLECVTWRPNDDGSGPRWDEGNFFRSYPGYDFDGFYEPGPSVCVKCSRHFGFARRMWYYDDLLKRMCCADPQPLLKERYVVCVMTND